MGNFKANTLYNLQKIIGLAILLTGMSVFYSGCETLPGPSATGYSEAKASSPEAEQSESDAPPGEEQKEEQKVEKSYRLTDVPVPGKFKMDRDKTFIYESGSIKAGIITYTGRAKLEALVDFYKKNMPEYEWEMVSIFEHNDVTIVYSKEGWRCNINLSVGSMRGSRIRIQIGPIDAP